MLWREGKVAEIIFGIFLTNIIEVQFLDCASLPRFCQSFIPPELKLEADITLDGILSGL